MDEGPLFEAAVDAAAKTEGVAYLGDRAMVNGLLRTVASGLLNSMASIKDPADRIARLKRGCRNTAAALLGQRSRFAPMPGWNTPGGIDAFCAKWLGIAETDPKDRMESAVLQMMNELFEVADYAGTPGVLEEQWRWQIDATLDWYTDLFLGVSPPQQAAAS